MITNVAEHAVVINFFKMAYDGHHTSECWEFRIISSKMSSEDMERMFLCHLGSLSEVTMSMLGKSPLDEFEQENLNNVQLCISLGNVQTRHISELGILK